jgi:group I intron endonuclease
MQEEKPYGWIYKVTNSLNGKSYIGQSVNPLSERWNDYKELRNKVKAQKKLYYALKKYGPESFIFESIDTAPNQLILDSLEDMYILKFNTISNGYNILRGGKRGWSGHKHTDDTKLKISKAMTGIKRTSTTLIKMSQASKSNNPMSSENNRLKVSEGLKRYWAKRKCTATLPLILGQ